MADSVDRVFGHALNTVNKIRTGSHKPPVNERLKLYGLYKQAMEGDVEYIQPRPTISSNNNDNAPDEAHVRREQDKWDAWHSHTGLSRTSAKRAYIETLISTMHLYASATPEARELVAELEFVWDQVRNNSNPSGSDRSSPLLQVHSSYPGISSAMAAGEELGIQQQPMRVLSPVRQGEENFDETDEREEFVDAPAYSQYEGEGEEEEEDQDRQGRREAHVAGDGRGSRNDTNAHRDYNEEDDSAIRDQSPIRPRPRRAASQENAQWRKRIESAMVKVSTEVAALREQLESRSYVAQKRRHSLIGWILRFSWFLVRIVVVDVFVLWLVILWLRRKKDRRLEGAVRVLLGDAVAQMQRVGSNMKVPKLPSRRS